MSELKYKKYILTELKLPEAQQKTAAEYAKRATRVLWLDGDAIEGAPLVSCSWYWKATDTEDPPVHTHDFDEVLGFFGNDWQKPHDLGGEIEFWLEEEKYVISNSCLIFVPRGLRHCPLRVRRIQRPIFHFMVGSDQRYTMEVISAKK